MGGDNSQPDLDLLQINFIQYFEDENFGFVKIFREIHSPYDFFMLLELTYHGVYASLPPQINQLRVLSTTKLKHVAEVIWINEAEEQRSLCTSPKLKLLQRYYNITLKYLKKSRFEKGQIFSQGEIWYLILAIQTTRDDLAKHAVLFPDLTLSQVFLSTKGEVFFYPNIKFLNSGDYRQDLNLDCYEHQPRLSTVKGRNLSDLIVELISPQNQLYYPHMKTLYSKQLISFLNSYNDKSSAQDFLRKNPAIKPDSCFDLGRERQQDGFRLRVYEKLSKHGAKQTVARGKGGWNMVKVRDFQQVKK